MPRLSKRQRERDKINGKRKPRNRPPGEDAKILTRREKALTLRVGGARYRQIAKENNCSLKTAYDDVQDECRAVNTLTGKQAEELVTLELERTDRLIRAAQAGVASGDPRAIEVTLRLSEARRKLLGLDAAMNAPPIEEILRTAAVLVGIIHTHIRDQRILDAIADQFETALGRLNPSGPTLLPAASTDDR